MLNSMSDLQHSPETHICVRRHLPPMSVLILISQPAIQESSIRNLVIYETYALDTVCFGFFMFLYFLINVMYNRWRRRVLKVNDKDWMILPVFDKGNGMFWHFTPFKIFHRNRWNHTWQNKHLRLLWTQGFGEF